MTSTDNSWFPASGRHAVSVGPSLGRALKARKGVAPPAKAKRANLPDREFYSFRYNFQPDSIDSSKPGTINIMGGNGSTSITVERSSTQKAESHLFSVSEMPSKEVDCVLIFDEETGTFTLEKLETYMVLNYDKKTSKPLPPNSKASSEEDAEGEPDEELIALRQEEEEGEEEEIMVPPRAPPPPQEKPKAQVQRPAKSSKNLSSSKGTSKRAVEADEENFDMGRAAQNVKRARKSPPSEGLALPGTFSIPSPGLGAPSPLGALSPMTAPSSLAEPSPLAAPPADVPSASDSEEDWDEVAADAPAHDTPLKHEIFLEEDNGDGDLEEGMEIDLADLEQEFNQTMGDEEEEELPEDFLAAALEDESQPQGQPVSLNAFASGEVGQEEDEDDYSSSDESDDE